MRLSHSNSQKSWLSGPTSTSGSLRRRRWTASVRPRPTSLCGFASVDSAARRLRR